MDEIKCNFSELFNASVEACGEMAAMQDNIMSSEVMYQKEDPNKEPLAWIVGSYTKLIGMILGTGIGLSNEVLDETSVATLKYYVSIALAVNTVEPDGLLRKLAKEIFHPDLIEHASLIQKVQFNNQGDMSKDEAVRLLQESMSKINPPKKKA